LCAVNLACGYAATSQLADAPGPDPDGDPLVTFHDLLYHHLAWLVLAERPLVPGGGDWLMGRVMGEGADGF
jgi:hypothetical protein